jgi:selenocysteine-specific elongation factor
VVTLAELGGLGELLDVLLEVSPRAKRPLCDGAQVRIHHGSTNVRAKVVYFRHKELAPGEEALAQLRLEANAFVFAGDRFVLRDSAGRNTLAGGVVLDPNPGRKAFRSEARLSFLRQRAETPGLVASFVASQIALDQAVRRPQLLLKSKFSTEDISRAVSQLAVEGKIVPAGDFAVDSARWLQLRGHAADVIDARHLAHPEQIALSLSDLRTNLEADLPFADLFESLVGDLCKSEFVKVGNTIRRMTHRRALPGPLQAAAAKLRNTLAAKPFDPPSRKQLEPDSASRQALRFLVDTGEAVEINAEVVLAAENLTRMTELIRRYIRDNGPATVSQLRQELGCSRRVIVPLLERLDRDGVTLRNGDTRTLRTK